MGDFRFATIDTWDVALHHGHTAFRLLHLVREVEQDYRAAELRQKEAPYGEAEYLRLLGLRSDLTRDMFRTSTASVMMFQAMMEAIINDSLERENVLAPLDKNGKFKTKWHTALDAVGADKAAFDVYFVGIYKRFRNPLVHPRAVEMADFDALSFRELHAGYYAGWRAYAELYEKLGHPHDSDSWRTICEAHELPAEIGGTP